MTFLVHLGNPMLGGKRHDNKFDKHIVFSVVDQVLYPASAYIYK